MCQNLKIINEKYFLTYDYNYMFIIELYYSNIEDGLLYILTPKIFNQLLIKFSNIKMEMKKIKLNF